MTSSEIIDWAIIIGRTVLTKCLDWFQLILQKCGGMNLWAGAVVFVAVFAILLLPLRGGASLGDGAFTGFILGRVNKAKKNTDD